MRYGFFALVALLAGCGVTQPIERVTTVEVKVPVMVPIPEPKPSVRPSLMIYELVDTDVSNPGKVIQYYQATIRQLLGYAVELETVIDGYRPTNTEKEPSK